MPSSLRVCWFLADFLTPAALASSSSGFWSLCTTVRRTPAFKNKGTFKFCPIYALGKGLIFLTLENAV